MHAITSKVVDLGRALTQYLRRSARLVVPERAELQTMSCPLTRALLANALFSVTSGLTFLLRSDAIAELIGLGPSWLYATIGGGLIGFALCVTLVALRKPINAFLAMLISLADLLWVIGTALLFVLAYAQMRPLGAAVLAAIAAVVLLFAILQLGGIGQRFAARGKPGTSRLCVAIDAPVRADDIWPLIADIASIGRYAPSLTQVLLRDNATPGVNAVRQCSNSAGQTWAERCERFDVESRAIDMQFLTNEAGFPYPFRTMRGGWQVLPNGQRATVQVWYEVAPKVTLLQPVILAVMSRGLARSFGEIVTRMVLAMRGTPVPTNVDPAQYDVAYLLADC
jgi:ribosome-associated toxin RatA of RatAB toxin-antitoxin module